MTWFPAKSCDWLGYPLKIFYHRFASSNLHRLRSLAACVGISSELVHVESGTSLAGMLKQQDFSNEAGAVFDLASLCHALDATQLQDIVTVLESTPVTVLLLVTEVGQSIHETLCTLTQGLVHTTVPMTGPARITFPQAAKSWSRELAGYSFPRHPGKALGLAANQASNVTCIAELDNIPIVACASLGKTRIFVWSALDIIDPLRPLSAEREFEEAKEQYIPAIVFLRSAFGDRCWHNPNAAGAIVIDDPLLKSHYGFINFPDLLASARRNGYRITLAFIPWNSWRSRTNQVQRFLKYQDCFSICVHGCDHTDNEYGSVDYDSLLGKNISAAARMERQRQRTGLPYEAIMVCPQEKYSVQAMRAFADGGQFVGLVNTSCMPRNSTSIPMCAADLLFPAQDSYYGFPVFKRHYWDGMSAFAMDRFLGKPAILVEHHDFFRDGCAGGEHFAAELSRLSPGVEWKPLCETMITTHSQRWLSETEREIRCFTRKFRFAHPGGRIKYNFSKRIPASIGVQQVLVNGIAAAFSREAELLFWDCQAEAPQTIDIQIETAQASPAKAYSFKLKYQTRVALRRVLSEFRDNVVSKNPIALKVSTSFLQTLRVALYRGPRETGDALSVGDSD